MGILRTNANISHENWDDDDDEDSFQNIPVTLTLIIMIPIFNANGSKIHLNFGNLGIELKRLIYGVQLLGTEKIDVHIERTFILAIK